MMSQENFEFAPFCLFFFFERRPKTLYKLQLLTFEQKQCLYLSRTNLESKFRFSESSFKFLKKTCHLNLYPRWYTAWTPTLYNPPCHCQQIAGLKKLMMSQENFNSAFFDYFFGKWAEALKKIATFQLWAKAMPLLRPFSPVILRKINI